MKIKKKKTRENTCATRILMILDNFGKFQILIGIIMNEKYYQFSWMVFGQWTP